MITLIVAAGLSAAAVQSPAVAAPRKAYASCLTGFAKKAADDRMARQAFDTALAAACALEKAAFRQAVVADDMKRGAGRQDAEEGADLQIEDYLANIRDGYEPPEAE